MKKMNWKSVYDKLTAVPKGSGQDGQKSGSGLGKILAVLGVLLLVCGGAVLAWKKLGGKLQGFRQRRAERRRKKGFSLTEVIAVVGIIAVLVSVAAVWVLNYRRSLHQMEMDAMAKEIFIAAQNHLTVAESQGYPGVDADEEGAFGIEEKETKDGALVGTGIYWYVVNGAANSTSPDDDTTALGLMLPFAAVDDTVRLGGSYVIRYQKDSGLVLDVFYADRVKRYPYTFTGTAAEEADLVANYRDSDTASKKSERAKYGANNAVIGWYGGTEITKLATVALEAPSILIENAERLRVYITNPNAGVTGAEIRLTVEGLLSGEKLLINLTDPDVSYVDLDDITVSGGRFWQICESKGKELIPGENIKITAMAYSNSALSNIAYSASGETNSLYADGTDTDNALVANIRHLENLDAMISRADWHDTASKLNIESAVQTADLSWTEFKTAIGGTVSVHYNGGDTTTTASGTYYPVSPSVYGGSDTAPITGFIYDGGGYSVSDVTVNTAANAGLFGSLQGGKVKDLELLDFDVESTGASAGALAGSTNGTAIENVLVRNTKTGGADRTLEITAGTGSAGGLVGALQGGSVTGSAAAVYVKSASGAAGGLLGTVSGTGVAVTDSYSGGHTDNGVYRNAETGSARLNVIGGTYAGGLIGDASGATVAVSYSYSTCSAKGTTAAGGLIGNAAAGTVTDCYSTGLVRSSGTAGAFVGAGGALSYQGDNKYFDIINEIVDTSSKTITYLPAVGSASGTVSNISSLDTDRNTYNAFVLAPKTGFGATASPYDTGLQAEFKTNWDLPTVSQLGGSSAYTFVGSHYGDWPSPETKVLNTLKASVGGGGSGGSSAPAGGFGPILKLRSAAVTYDMNANIPDGAELQALQLSPDSPEYAEMLKRAVNVLGLKAADLGGSGLVDLTILKDGTELQPGDPVLVQLELTEPWTGGSLHIVHFGEKVEEVYAAVSGSTVTFAADGFSVYGILKHEGDTSVITPRVEFHFISENYTANGDGTYTAPGYAFVNKHNEYQITQILRNGETLERIANPHNKKDENGKELRYFYGWYTAALVNGGDTTAWNSETSSWTGTITYTWPAPQQILFERTLTIAHDGSPAVGETVNWSMGSASGSAVLDEDGVAHVYLLPLYEEYYFVNFHMGNKEAGDNLRNNLLDRRLVVFGTDTNVFTRIGDIEGPSPDPAHQIFYGWETAKDEDGDGVLETAVFYQTLDGNGEEIDKTVDLTGSETTSVGDGFNIQVQKTSSAPQYLNLYPVFAEARWLYYDLGASGNGAGYVPAAYRLTNDGGKGTGFDALATTSRPGYTFGGWYLDAAMDEHSVIRNEGGAYDLVVENKETVEGGAEITTTTTIHYTGAAIRLTDASGAFLPGVKGKTFYARKSEYGVETETVVSAAQINKERTVQTYMANTGSLPAGTLAAGDEWLKLFEITADGKLYVYRDLDSLTVGAYWRAYTVSYTVVYWLQNANDDDYSLMYYKVLQGTAGTQTNAQTAQQDDTFVLNGKTYYPYEEYKLKYAHLSTDQDKDKAGDQVGVQQQEIEGNGSTIVNVYYDRNLYTLRFDIGYSTKSNTGSTTDYLAMTAEEAAAYTGTVYGYADGELIVLQKTADGKFVYADAEGKPYGVVGGVYVPLKEQTLDPVQKYIPACKYERTTDNGEGLFALDAATGDFLPLGYELNTIPGISYYKLISTITDGKEYLIVSRNTNGTGYALGHNGTTILSNDQVVVNNANTNINARFINGDQADSASVWTAKASGTNWNFENNGYYISQTLTQVGRVLAMSQTPGTWTWNSGNNRLSIRPGNTTYYLRYNNDAFSITNSNNSVYLYEKTDTTTTTHTYTLNDLPYENTLPRYASVENNIPTKYTADQLTEHNGALYYHDMTGMYGPANGETGTWIPVVDAGVEGTTVYYNGSTEYTDPPVMMSEYTGALYKQVTITTGTTTYYVSYITNTNNYNDFLATTGTAASCGTTIPADFIPCGRYTETKNRTTYTVYYYDLTARFGENIADRWPDLQPDRPNNYGFIGWVAQPNSYYWNEINDSSIKGKYEVMDEGIICVRTSGNYTATTAENGITHEMRCRYERNLNKYVYRIYMWDPTLPGDGFPDTPTHEMKVNSKGVPSNQAIMSYIGYTEPDEVVKKVVRGGENNPEENISNTNNTYSPYYVTSVGYNAMIINYYYRPNLHHISYKYGQGQPDGVINTEIGNALERYYNQSLADANIYNDIAVEATPLGHSFAGWYENPDGVGNRFNFNTTMPDSDIVLYAVYKPLEYLIKINPNGAEIDHIDHTGASYSGFATPLNRPAVSGDRNADSGYRKDQSAYFFGVYNEQVGEYAVSRSFVPISNTAAAAYTAEGRHVYVYANIQYLGGNVDGEWGVPQDLRNALYLDATYGTGQYKNGDASQGETELYTLYKFYHDFIANEYAVNPGYWDCDGAKELSFDAWKALFVEKNSDGGLQLYRKCNSQEHWVFLGWFKTTEAGVEESMPYNFSDPVTGPFTLTAHWRLDGGYIIQYTPEYIMNDGSVINGSVDSWTDPPTETYQNLQMTYTDGAYTTVFKQPTELTLNGVPVEDDELIFLGWQVVNVTHDGDGNPIYTPANPGEYFDSAADFFVRVNDADKDSYVHLQAVYQTRSESVRRPSYANMTLNANTGYLVDADGAEPTEAVDLPAKGVGSIRLDPATGEVYLKFMQANATVRLKEYADDPCYFLHEDDSFLLGFDDAADEGDFIATYPTDGTVSIGRNDDDNTIYAVWEPLVYMSFVNQTGGTVTFSLEKSDADALKVINVKEGTYERTPLTNLSSITLAAGERLDLAFPHAKEKTVTVSGVNSLGVGKVLKWDTSLDLVAGGTTSSYSTGGSDVTYTHTPAGGTAHSHTLAAGHVNNTLPFEFSETPILNEKPIVVTFTSDTNDYALLLDDNYPGGGVQEIDYSYADIIPENGVAKTQPLPTTSTRVGYSFIGWAETQEKAAAGTPDYDASNPASAPWTILDLNPDDGFFSQYVLIDGVKTRTLYAVWTVRTDAVYVYKDVPAPGDQTQDFTFTVGFTGTFKYGTNGSSSENINKSATFTLKHGWYLKIASTNDNATQNGTAYIDSLVQVFDASDVQQGTDTHIRWEKSVTARSTNSIQNLNFTVTETANPAYATTVRLDAHTYNSATGKGNPLYLGTVTTIQEPPVTADTNTFHWNNSDAGGTVTFTNTVNTYSVTVEKILHSDTTAQQIFTFDASYVLGGVKTDLGAFAVNSGTTNNTALANIPAGAVLTIAEQNDGSYSTQYKVDSGSYTAGSTAVVTVDSDKAVTFENTLKSYDVKFVKTDQDGRPGTLEALFKLDAATYTLGTNLLADDNGIGVFYQSGGSNRKLYVGTYTLTETWHAEGYIGLEAPVTITVSGDTANPFTFSDPNVTAEYDSANSIWVIKVKNQAIKTVTLKKVLDDPIITQRTITFKYSYEYDGRTVQGSMTLTPRKNQPDSKNLSVPVGATNLTFEEQADSGALDVYDVTYSTGSGSSGTGITCTIPSVTQDETVTFTNTRKKYDLTVKKVLTDELQNNTGTFDFSYMVSYGADILTPLAEFQVEAGGTGEVLYEIWAGSKVTVTEKETEKLYQTTWVISSTSGSFNSTGSGRMFNLDMPNSDAELVFTNDRTLAPITVTKEIPEIYDDAARRFNVSAEVTEAGTSVVINASGQITTETSYEFSVPVGSNVTVTESDTLADGGTLSTIYTTRYKLDGGAAVDGTSAAISGVSKDGHTVTFVNTRKTVNVTVTKEVTDEDKTGDFTFTAAAVCGGKPVALAAADADFTLQNGGSKIIALPYGSNLTVTETAEGYEATIIFGSSSVTESSCTVTGVTGDTKILVQNKRNAADAVFLKIDGNGDALEGAVFGLFRDAECSDKVASATSAADGTVTLQKITAGDYYLKETGLVDGWKPVNPVYYINVDNTGKITDKDTGEELIVVMNESSILRKVILKKLIKNNYDVAPGAKFTIYRADMTPYTPNGANFGPSSDNGAFFVGSLPIGVYYLKETTVPSNCVDPGDQYFKIKVELNGTTCEGLCAAPTYELPAAPDTP